MFPSNNNNGGYSHDLLLSYSHDQSILQYRPFFNDINSSNSRQDQDPPLCNNFLHNFQSPNFLLHDHELQYELGHDVFPQQQQQVHHDHPHQPLRVLVHNMVDDSSKTDHLEGHSKTSIPARKRSSKRDRHSKINTAKGPRDRRMRLSLEVARDFFGLQDMLGYDKASKTVEWLLIQANSEINKLATELNPQMMMNNYSSSTVGGGKSASSTSECEVVSGMNDSAAILKNEKPSVKEKKVRHSRKFSLRPLSRDLREKARERARERTRKKMWNRNISSGGEGKNNNELNQIGSSFETCEESGNYQSHNRDHSHNSLEVVAAEVNEDPNSSHSQHSEYNLGNQDCMVDDSLVIMGKWSPSSIFNYLHNLGTPQEHQSAADFQFFGKQ